MSVASRANKLQRASSRKWNFFFGIILAAVLFVSVALRFYVIEPIRVIGNSLDPIVPAGSSIWVCKLPTCTHKLTRGDIVLIQLPDGEKVLREVVGLPGDSIFISADGKIQSAENSFTWEDESEIISPRNFQIPRRGDSLQIKNLNDISFDYAVAMLQRKKGLRKFYTEATLFRGKDSLSLSRVGSTSLAGRPVSIREIHGFHWQEYFLIGLQINREDPGGTPVHFERKIFNAEDSTDISSIPVRDNYYYVICTQRSRCEDSRQFGYISQESIRAKMIHFP